MAEADELLQAARYPADPDLECDLVMKGGITSGVVYPHAICEFATRYRLRSIGGASAGAIGAAFGAAAEFGRASGGFARLAELPRLLGGNRLQRLFQPTRQTRPVYELMTANGFAARLSRAPRVFWRATLCGLLVLSAFVALGVRTGGVAGVALLATALIVGLVVVIAGIGWRLWRIFTVHVPANRFGLCTGLHVIPNRSLWQRLTRKQVVAKATAEPGFTEWLSDQLNAVAGLGRETPLTFGHLWSGDTVPAGGPVRKAERQVDLRMITTCLSQGRPYEMPWDARSFFIAEDDARALFPPQVVAALIVGPSADEFTGTATDEWEEWVGARQSNRLFRLPEPHLLPVIVAVRMSLSFPLLISAIPLYTIDRRADTNKKALKAFRKRKAGEPLPEGLEFTKLWFSDGGFCSNFPVHLFDAALPTRPTFAINLGRLAGSASPTETSIAMAESNDEGILPFNNEIKERGFAAVSGFGQAAFDAARNWFDSTQLQQPGYRDRIVKVLQSKREGGMNLDMDLETIEGLSNRGRYAAKALRNQFETTQYANGATGWDNHRWVRYRSLLSTLPVWVRSFSEGYKSLNIDSSAPPSYDLSGCKNLATDLTAKLNEMATLVDKAGTAAGTLSAQPRPRSSLRRVPSL